MEFRVLPVIDLMLALYEKPLAPERFHAYLKLLQGNSKGDILLPVYAFNPMAKEDAIEKLKALKALDAEEIIKELLPELNAAVAGYKDQSTIGIALNLSDDLKGGWTNRYTSDYDSKFRINALVTRNFCTPILWAGEDHTLEIIKQRIKEYAWRSVYRKMNPAPLILKDHVTQESFVALHAGTVLPIEIETAQNDTAGLYETHRDSEDYHVIFNFLYGSKAAASLEFPVAFEMADRGGFHYAITLAKH
jgi:hypothetical protein